jgi:Protein of unknown function (DUF1573)
MQDRQSPIVPILASLFLGSLGFAAGWLHFKSDTDSAKEIFEDPAKRIANIGTAIENRPLPGSEKKIGPKVQVIGGKVHNFGAMERGTSRKHSFVFKNEGDEKLILEVAGSTCKCTIGKLEKAELQPGEETSIELTWTAEGVLEQFGQSARIVTNDPENIEISLEIRGFISKAIVFDPIRLLFGDVSSKETVSQKTTLFSSYAEPLVIEKAVWNDSRTADRVTITHSVRAVEPGSDPRHMDAKYAADFVVELKPGLPTGPINGIFTIETNFAQVLPITFPVEARVYSAFRISGGTQYNERQNLMALGKVSGAKGATFNMLIAARAEEDQNISLTVGEVIPDCVKVTIDEPTRRGGQLFFRINLDIPPGTEPVSFPGTNPKNFGKIVFRSNIESSPEIPVFLRIDVEP